jgi:hypothetical protein
MSTRKYIGTTGGLIKDLYAAAREGNIERLRLGLFRDPNLLNLPQMM